MDQHIDQHSFLIPKPIHGWYISRQSLEGRLSMGWVSVECRSSTDWASAKYWLICQPLLDWQTYLPRYRPILNQYPTDPWPTLDQCSTNTRRTISPYMLVDISVDSVNQHYLNMTQAVFILCKLKDCKASSQIPLGTVVL